MRVLIVGAGGVGGYLGALLARREHEVTFVARGAHLDALRHDGLEVQSRMHGTMKVHVRAVATAAEIEPVELADVVLFCVKTYDLLGAVELVRPLVGPQTRIVPVQNGVDAPDLLRVAFPHAGVLGGIAQVGANLVRPGLVQEVAGITRLVIGRLPTGPAAEVEDLAATFRDAGIDASTSETIERVLWDKFVWACAFSGMTAAAQATVEAILTRPPARALFEATLDETMHIGRAAGVALPDDTVTRALDVAGSLAAGTTSSLARDVAAGRRDELDALNGAAVRIARERSVPAPLNEALLGIVNARRTTVA